jgi:hypothetical protein
MTHAPGKFVVSPAIKFSAQHGFPNTTPLLEEEGHLFSTALVSNGEHPFLLHASGTGSAFASHNYPMNAFQVHSTKVLEQRLHGQESSMGVRTPQIINAGQTVLSILNAGSPPYMRLRGCKLQR